MRLFRSRRSDPRILVCTVATEWSEGLERCSESCRQVGIDLQVFGLGQEWGGLIWRQRQLYRNLIRRRLQYEYVLFIDGYDSIVTTPLSEIFQRYRALDTPLLFAAEVLSHPLPAERYPAATASYRYRYLNAGGFIGRLRHVVRLMTVLRLPWRLAFEYDQEIYAKAYVANRGRIALDHRCEIFQCLFFAGDDVARKDGRVVNTFTGTTPCIIHANGGQSLDGIRDLDPSPAVAIEAWEAGTCR